MFRVRVLDGPLLAGAAGRDVAVMTIGGSALQFDFGDRTVLNVPVDALKGVKKAGGKLKLLLTPDPAGPGHVVALLAEGSVELEAESSPRVVEFRRAIVAASKGKKTTPDTVPQGASGVMKTFRSDSHASKKGRAIAAEGASKPQAAAPTAEDALALEMGASRDEVAAAEAEVDLQAGRLPGESVRALALESNEQLRKDHEMFVVKGGVVDEEAFWMLSEERRGALMDASARLRQRAVSRRVDAMRARKQVGMKELFVFDNPEAMQQTVAQLLGMDEKLRKAYKENVVSGRVGAEEFWRRYLAHRVRQEKQRELRRREDAIAGRVSSAPLTSRSGDDQLFQGVGAPTEGITVDIGRVRSVPRDIDLEATAQDWRRGVLSSGQTRGGYGTASTLYAPDDITASSEQEAVRVRQREAHADSVAAECNSFGEFAMRHLKRAREETEGDDSLEADLSEHHANPPKALVLEFPDSDTQVPEGRQCRIVRYSQADKTVPMGEVSGRLVENFLWLVKHTTGRGTEPARSSTGMPMTISKDWRRWLHDSARKGTEVLTSTWRQSSRDLSAVEERLRGLEQGRTKLRKDAKLAAACEPIICMLERPLRNALDKLRGNTRE
jgi:hypothetical protein